jgi:hypothetical protein
MTAVRPISLAPRLSAKPSGDREVRDLLKRHLVDSLIDLDTIVLDELGLCQGNVRIDVASVGDELSGFEIKSPADRLTRWPKQCRYYSKVVDRAWLVATEQALEKAQPPAWWGLIRIVQTPDRLGLRVVRPALPNPRPHAYSIARLLWRDEAIQALDALGLARGVRSKRRAEAWRRLADQAPLDHLRASVRAALKVRSNRVEELQR